ncbi:MAG: flippase, partial [Anaerolineae bacterium]
MTSNSIQEEAAGADETKSRIAHTTRNFAAVALSTLIANGVQFLWIIVLARIVGDETFGVWSKIAAFVGIAAAIPEFSSNLIVLRDVAQRPDQGGRYLSATLILQPILGVIAVLALNVVGLFLNNDAASRTLLFVASLTLIVDTFGTMAHNQLLAVERMTIMSAITVAYRLLVVALALIALLLGGSLLQVYEVTILAGVIRALMYWWALRRFQIKPVFPVSRQMVRYMLRESWSVGMGLLLLFTYRYVNTLIVASVLGNKENGYFGAAFTIVFGIIELSSSTVLVALSPLMSRLASGNREQLRALVDNFSFLTVALALPLGVAISLLAGNLSALLFPGFVGTAAILEVMIWQGVASMISDIYSQSMTVQGKQNAVFLIRVVGILTNVILNAILLPQIQGARGAAIASLGAQIVVLALMLRDHQLDSMIQRFGGRYLRI